MYNKKREGTSALIWDKTEKLNTNSLKLPLSTVERKDLQPNWTIEKDCVAHYDQQAYHSEVTHRFYYWQREDLCGGNF